MKIDREAIRERLKLLRGPVDHEFSPLEKHVYPRFCAMCGGNEHVHLYREHISALLDDLEAAEKVNGTAHEFVINESEDWHDWVSVRKCLGYFLPNRVMWKVMRGGSILAKDGGLECEPQPSSRDEDFYARCRFDTFDEAMQAARRLLAGEGGEKDETSMVG